MQHITAQQHNPCAAAVAASMHIINAQEKI